MWSRRFRDNEVRGSGPFSRCRESGFRVVGEALRLAAARFDPTSAPPADEEPFSTNDSIGAWGDGDWPPAVAYLVNEEAPEDIPARYAEGCCTVLDGTFATIPAANSDAVLAELAAMGFALVEEPRVAELVDTRF